MPVTKGLISIGLRLKRCAEKWNRFQVVINRFFSSLELADLRLKRRLYAYTQKSLFNQFSGLSHLSIVTFIWPLFSSAGGELSFPDDLSVYFNECLFGTKLKGATSGEIGLESPHTNQKRAARENAGRLRRTLRGDKEIKPMKDQRKAKTEL
jgi:hypothetical protein